MTATPNGSGPAPSRPLPGPQAMNTGGWERTNGTGRPPAGPGPPNRSTAPDPRRQHSGRQAPHWSGKRRRPLARGRARHGSPTDPQAADH